MATQGPNYPANITDGGGINPWTNPTTIGAEDGANATLNAASLVGPTSNQLLALNFGFSIPEDSTINGILVEIKRGATLNTGSENFEDHELFMEEDGSFTVNFAEPGNWDTSVDWHSYGGPTNLLGIDDFLGDSYATADDINYEGWGVSIRVNGAGVSAQALVDAIRITVYYNTEYIAADCRATATATCDVTIAPAEPPEPFPACVHEVTSDTQYVVEWTSCTIYIVDWTSCAPLPIEWTSCTISVIEWTSDTVGIIEWSSDCQ